MIVKKNRKHFKNIMKGICCGMLLMIIVFNLWGCNLNNNEKDEIGQLGALKQDTLLIDAEGSNINVEYINTYNIEVELDPDQDQIRGKQKVRYVNNTEEKLKEVYFNLYPNAFKDQATAPMLFDKKVGSAHYQSGYIELITVEVNEEKVNYQISGMGETLLKIPLEEQLSPDEAIEVYMEYKIQIPNIKERFGVWEKTYNLGNWYPVAAVYDHKGWNLEPYYSVGDPFYSEVANYDVTITMPEEMVLASSGNIISHTTKNDKGIWKVEAKLMRDFAWSTSPHFQLEEIMVGDTVVKMYFLTKDSQVKKKAKEYTVNSLKTFNDIFEPYPYGHYSVVETNFPSGMEYPGLVFIGEQYYNKNNLESLELIIVHETGHQWWYGVVGNDQINEAWLDESLTTYSEVIYFREVYDEKKGINHHESRNERSYDIVKQQLKDQRILKPLSEFEGWFDYGALVYSHGANMLYDLEKKYGKEKMYEILRSYYREYQFKVATSEDFIKTSEKVLGENQEMYFKSWLYGQ